MDDSNFDNTKCYDFVMQLLPNNNNNNNNNNYINFNQILTKTQT